MNTEQIMALATAWRTASYADRDTHKAALQAAIEALVQERDALQKEQPAGTSTALELANDLLNNVTHIRQADAAAALRRLDAENGAMKSSIEALEQARDEYREKMFSWVHANSAGGWIDGLRLECDKLAAENKVLRDALARIKARESNDWNSSPDNPENY